MVRTYQHSLNALKSPSAVGRIRELFHPKNRPLVLTHHSGLAGRCRCLSTSPSMRLRFNLRDICAAPSVLMQTSLTPPPGSLSSAEIPTFAARHLATTFLIQVQTWWAMFALRTVEHWSFAAFLIVLLQPVAIFMMAALIVPRVVAGEMTDLREDYYREFRWFFSALLLALAASIAKNLILTRSLPEPPNLAAHVLFVAISVGALLLKSARAQLILALAGLALLSGYIALLFTTLS